MASVTETRNFKVAIGFRGSNRVEKFSPRINRGTLNFHVLHPNHGSKTLVLIKLGSFEKTLTYYESFSWSWALSFWFEKWSSWVWLFEIKVLCILLLEVLIFGSSSLRSTPGDMLRTFWSLNQHWRRLSKRKSHHQRPTSYPGKPIRVLCNHKDRWNNKFNVLR